MNALSAARRRIGFSCQIVEIGTVDSFKIRRLEALRIDKHEVADAGSCRYFQGR